MADAEIKYVRKLSGEEAQKRFILIPKDSLSLFPKVGTLFKLMIDGELIDVAIKLHEARTMGGRKGIVEYHLDLSKHPTLFRPRYEQAVVIEKKGDYYALRLS